MSVMALTLQSGTGLGSFQSGNAFIALGAAYFISSLLSSTVVEHFGNGVYRFRAGVYRQQFLRADRHRQAREAVTQAWRPG